MPNLTIKQAALFCGKDEKTVRRWITGKHPRVPKVADTKGRYLITQSDVERIMAEDTITRAPTIDETRLAELEQRIERLEHALQETRHMLERLAAATSSIASPTDQTPRIVSQRVAFARSTLPDGWIPINDLIKEYQVPRSTAMRHMKPFLKVGKWRVGGHEVLNALDEAGQAEFLKLFGGQE